MALWGPLCGAPCQLDASTEMRLAVGLDTGVARAGLLLVCGGGSGASHLLT